MRAPKNSSCGARGRAATSLSNCGFRSVSPSGGAPLKTQIAAATYSAPVFGNHFGRRVMNTSWIETWPHRGSRPDKEWDIGGGRVALPVQREDEYAVGPFLCRSREHDLALARLPDQFRHLLGALFAHARVAAPRHLGHDLPLQGESIALRVAHLQACGVAAAAIQADGAGGGPAVDGQFLDARGEVGGPLSRPHVLHHVDALGPLTRFQKHAVPGVGPLLPPQI